MRCIAPVSINQHFHCDFDTGKGGKNRRRGKNEGDEKRELVNKEEGQGECNAALTGTAAGRD